MKEKTLSFLKPRLWTVFLALVLVAWEYVYAFRGIDFEVLGKVRSYFGFGFSAINWNNFLVRTLSMALIWVMVALVIFFFLWVAETVVIGSHNRKISRKYTNRPAEDYDHLLRTGSVSFKKNLISVLWLSAFLILIPLGLFLLAGLIEALRSNLVISYITNALDSGEMVDYYDTNLVIVSFLLTLPFWYLYSCFDTWAYLKSKNEGRMAKIESDHYAVPVVEPESFDKDTDLKDEEENDFTSSSAPVI